MSRKHKTSVYCVNRFNEVSSYKNAVFSVDEFNFFLVQNFDNVQVYKNLRNNLKTFKIF
jgi:uncharacterized membrane-anchored protein YitT (DUF2179 family)